MVCVLGLVVVIVLLGTTVKPKVLKIPQDLVEWEASFNYSNLVADATTSADECLNDCSNKVDACSRRIRRRARQPPDCERSADVCSNGATCVNGLCDCLPEYEGRYCNKAKNYCGARTCPERVFCESRVGGFNCDCPLGRTGAACLLPESPTVATLKSPNFLYSPLQNAGMEFPHCFYSVSIGSSLHLIIDFGDGIVERIGSNDFVTYNNFRMDIFNTFLPPLMVPFSYVQAYIVNHVYEEPGYYELAVKVVDDYRLIFDSTYTVNVRASKYCHLNLRILNAAQRPEDAHTFKRYDDISIKSDIDVNCTQAKYTLSWAVYGADTDRNFLEGSDITSGGLHLLINRFALPLGRYEARVWLEMTEPNYFNESANTWFVITEGLPVPKLLGGAIIQHPPDLPLRLDASVTRDLTNPVEVELLKSYRFYWSCETSVGFETASDKYCSSGQPYLNETGPVLIVPAHSLINGTRYRFKVAVNNADNAFNFMVKSVQSDDLPLRMECLENCEEKINPEKVTSMRVICHDCTKEWGNYLFKWDVLKITATGEDTSWRLGETQTELGLNYNVIYIDSDVLDFGATYLFDFNTYYLNMTNAETKEKPIVGKVATMRSTVDAYTPFKANCTISPKIGKSVFTSFTVTCSVGVQNVTSLVYEVFQTLPMDDSSLQETLVSYGYSSKITDVILTSGRPDWNHVTTLRVAITGDQLHEQAQTLLQVTVLPASFQTRLPDRLLAEIHQKLFGAESVLGRFHATENSYRIIQLVRCTAASLRDLIQQEYYRVFERGEESKEFFMNVFVLKEAMLEYLSQQSVLNVQELKHFATSALTVLRLPCLHKLPSTHQVVHAIFENIVDSVEMFNNADAVSKYDLLQLGTSIISIGSLMLRNTTTIRDTSNYSRYSEEDLIKSESYDWVIKTLLWTEAKHATLRSLTVSVGRRILQYGEFVAKFLPINGPGMLILADYVQLRVERGLLKQTLAFSLAYSRGEVKPYIGKKYSEAIFVVSSLEVHSNPYWWHSSLKNNIFPMVVIDAFDDVRNTKVSVSGRIELDPIKGSPEVELFHGKLKVIPFWMLNDSHIHIHRFTVLQDGKIGIYVAPIQEKIQLVLIKGFRPTIQDFWNDAITIPRTDKRKQEGPRHLFVVEHMALEVGETVYVGVLPHVETLRNLLSHGHPLDIVSDEDSSLGNDGGEDGFENVEETTHHDDDITIRSIPYAFSLQTLNCYNLNPHSLEMERVCFVNQSDSYMLACTCEALRIPIIEVTSLQRRPSFPADLRFAVTTVDSPVVLTVVFYIVSVFAGLFLWARYADQEDRTAQNMIYLQDNDPTHDYTYVLMVFTGSRPHAGTTSKVAIQLVGREANSEIHILTDGRRPVLARGSQEWFLLKAERELGDIAWINLWHDHSGASPEWYCDRVLIHDVITDDVWIFDASQWLGPLHGDGTMSCSVDRTLDFAVFEKGNRFYRYFMHGCDVGHHGWFGMLLKRTSGCFTRCQRVAATLVQTSVITLIVSFGYGDESTVKDAGIEDVYRGMFAALWASPVFLVLYYLFHCVEPSTRAAPEMRDYAPRSLVFDFGDESRNHHRAPQSDAVKLPYTVNKHRARQSKQERESVGSRTRIRGERIIDEMFCLPAWSLYIAWPVMIVVVVVCLYFSAFQGIVLSKIVAVCFLVAFVTAILSSMVLETVKVALFALFYLLFTNTHVMTVEDRSESVRYMNEAHEEMNQDFLQQRVGELKTLRRQAIYKPIPQARVRILRRAAIAEATARHAAGDVGIFFLFAIILLCISGGTRHPHQVIYVNAIKDIVHNGRTAIEEIGSQEEFVAFINETIIPNIFTEFPSDDENTERYGKLVDRNNRLLGVPRLRQIRIDPDGACSGFPAISGRQRGCDVDLFWIEGDTRHYGPSWRALDPANNNVTTDGEDAAIWRHNGADALETPSFTGYASTYPGGGYVATLARTAKASRLILSRLAAHGWLDRRTAALFLEFPSYNPNVKMVATITVLGERGVSGGYHVTSHVSASKMSPESSLAVFVVMMVVLLAVLAVIMVTIRDESKRIARLSLTRYTGDYWYALRVAVFLLEGAAISLFFMSEMSERAAVRKLTSVETAEFLNFYGIVYWAEVITIIEGVTFFLITIELWHILAIDFRFQIMMTTLRVAGYSIFCYFILFILFVLAFVMSGHVLFANSSFNFRTVWSSVITVCGFSHKQMFLGTPVDVHESTFVACRDVFYFLFFLGYMFVFRWEFAVVLMGKYNQVVSFARDAWLEPVLDGRVRAWLGSRPPNKTITQEYVQAVAKLFNDEASAIRKLPPARFLAMARIVERLTSRQAEEESEFLSHARSLAMASLVVGRIRDGASKTATEDPGLMARARSLVGTYLKMAELLDKVDKLYDVVGDVVDEDDRVDDDRSE